MTTKDQERKALAQIKKIVDGLGENSYVATAFEGCFEVAEENINNDFACSLLQRCDKLEMEYIVAQDRITDYIKQVERLEKENESLRRQVASQIKQKTEAEKKMLPEALKNTIIASLEDKAAKARQTMARFADTMSDYSETPADIAFINAAKWYKVSKNEAIRTESLIEQLKIF